MTLASALLLGIYDVAKKKALEKNGVYYVLLVATALTTLFLCPFLKAGPASHFLCIGVKSVLVTASWVAGMYGLKLLPITTVSTLKASRPMFVVLFSILLFGERLDWVQWIGVVTVLAALWLLSRSSAKEGIRFSSSKGFWAMVISIFAGVASALFDKWILNGMGMEPLFVQSWTNCFITVILAVIIAIQALHDGPEKRARFKWDWLLVLIAVFITAADALYFFALKQPDALLSVISLIRRSSVIVTFALGAWLFKDRNVRDKALIMALLLVGIVLLAVSSL
ncbi:MAG: DMT family transporter [Bacteroidales bacterium]|nr:DMT family transporter [Bacteroidales bacterium]